VIDQQPRVGFSGQDVPPEDVFNQCVRCGLCLPTCPSGVRYGELLEPARTQIVRATAPTRSPSASFGRSVLIGTLFSQLWFMRLVASFMRFYQRSGLQAFARSSGILRALRLDELEALAPRMSSPFFVAAGQRFSAQGTRKATAFLHAGCIMHVAFADWNEASVRVLNRAGIDVIVPADQGCCGAITIHAGEMDRGRALAKRNIASFERSGADVYVINAAGCGSALKEYGQLFHEDPAWHERAVAFSAKVRDITEYLDQVGVGPGLGNVNAVVTYQDPCHLAHAQRITAAPRRLLAQIPGLEIREMEESSLCCGSAGIYNVTQPEMAGRLGRRKVQHVLDVTPDILATANPGCALQIANGLRTTGRNIEVLHVVQLLDRAYSVIPSGASQGA
jgi:glycolate oxidase iron-sulfur subunit